MIDSSKIREEAERKKAPETDSWAYQVAFVTHKELNGGLIKDKLKELDAHIEVLSLNETKLANAGGSDDED